MSRLILSQFKQAVDGVEVDRSLDAEDIDREFSRVAKMLNGGLGPENMASTYKIPASLLRESRSRVSLRANGDTHVVGPGRWLLGVVGDASWVPVKLEVASYFTATGDEFYAPGSDYELLVGASVIATFTTNSAVETITTFAAGPFATGAVVYLRKTDANPEGTTPGVIATLTFAVPHAS